jgi:hypothetical protein
MKVVFWIIAAIAAIFVIGAAVGPGKSEQEAKKECVEALASNMGHSTYGYADKAAYDSRVRDKCAGFQLNGHDLGR